MFIPAVVVERARELAGGGRDFSTVVRMLAIEGNGTWPRKTLLRRVRSTSSTPPRGRGQKVRRCSAVDVAGEQLLRVAKTNTPAGRFAVLEAEAVAAAYVGYDSKRYHAAIAAMHASVDHPEGAGPCGCYSCGFAASPRGRR